MMEKLRICCMGRWHRRLAAQNRNYRMTATRNPDRPACASFSLVIHGLAIMARASSTPTSQGMADRRCRSAGRRGSTIGHARSNRFLTFART
jgi:hypothetical protein